MQLEPVEVGKVEAPMPSRVKVNRCAPPTPPMPAIAIRLRRRRLLLRLGDPAEVSSKRLAIREGGGAGLTQNRALVSVAGATEEVA